MWWHDKEIFPQGSLKNEADLKNRISFLNSHYSSYTALTDPTQQKSFEKLWAKELKSYGVVNQDLSESNDIIQEILNTQRYVVTTGQQAMIAGGPLLVLYKAYAAIEHTKEISKKIQQKTAIVFWIAGDDSDWDEVNHFEHLKSQSVFKFSPENHQDGQTISSTFLSPSQIADWKEWLNQPERSDLNNHLEELEGYFQKGDSLVVSMGRWLKSVFPQNDFLVIDGGGEAVRSFETARMKLVLHENLNFQERLSEQSLFLKTKSIQTQVPLDESKPRCFVLKQNQRFRRYIHEDFHEFELVHDALSRPILVESLFPVIGHILGPAELKYFALLQGSFEIFGMKSPLVSKRLNASLFRIHEKSILDDTQLTSPQLAQSHFQDLARALFDTKYATLNTGLKNRSFEWPELGDLEEQGLDSKRQQEIKSRMESKLKQDWDNVLKMVQKTIIHQDQAIQDRAREATNWLGSGRIQERNLSYWEAQSQLPQLMSLLKELDGCSEDHQYGEYYESP